MSVKCRMVEQGYEQGSCLVWMLDGKKVRACEGMLRNEAGMYFRLIQSAHLSRPEHYFSIYQSGCNHSCRKCHSWEFSKYYSGKWLSTDEIAERVAGYERLVNWWEPRERATMWHATDLCRSCGQCIFSGEPGSLCPQKLKPEQVLLSPQGFGPARNIATFTGGDISCQAEFYAEATRKIKERCENMWILLETNGYGLTPENLDVLLEAGLDSFWLDIKAFYPEVYKALCGTSNKMVLKAPEEIVKRGFVLEVLALFIPGWVESDQLKEIARLVCDVDKEIPMTLLAFFPAYKLAKNSAPSLSQMTEAYDVIKDVGLKNVKLGNCGVFAKTERDWKRLLDAVGKAGIG